MHQAALIVRTQNQRIRAYPVSDVEGVYFQESQQLCRDLFHGCDLVSWQGRDVIVDMRLVDERGVEHRVVHDAVAQQLVVQ